jgi:hypothetical protein
MGVNVSVHTDNIRSSGRTFATSPRRRRRCPVRDPLRDEQEILVRGDSAFGTSPVVDACVRAGVQFSLVLVKNTSVNAAIASITEDAWTPVRYPGAVVDPDTGELIPDAELAEATYTAFGSTEHPVTARLVVRRVRDRAKAEELFPVWRYHRFFTNSNEPTTEADITPPPTRDHRDRLRRPHRRPSRTHPLRAFLGQQRVGDLCCDHPQPAPRRRHPDQPQTCRGSRRDATTPPRQRARAARPTATTPSAPSTGALALGHTVDRALAQGPFPRHRTTRPRLRPDHPPRGPTGELPFWV